MPHKLPFRVIHVSGQDDSYRATELNYHSPLTKGWQAARYCLYPQDIILQLDQRSRLRKIQLLSHQFLVATKIEFFVGDIPDEEATTLEHARYTRLGYVSLSDNEKTGFKARELKSVHVDAMGLYLKLNIHKNHINKFNLYNQVGVIAINVIGDEIHRPADILDPDIHLDFDGKKNYDNDQGLDRLYSRPDYISPLDDLAFDMYQDPEVAQIIRKLEKRKQESVRDDRFDYAKKLKKVIEDLQKAGEKLGKYEVEKRQAVENEDYDKAKLKKEQMDDYRLQVYRDLNLDELMDTNDTIQSTRRSQDVVHIIETTRELSPVHYEEHHQLSPVRTPPPRTPYDDRPIPASKNREPPIELSTPPPKTPYDDRPLPVSKVTAPPPDDDEDFGDQGNGDEPGQMTEKDLRAASSAIDAFGEQLVSKAYSKTWSYREDALLAVYKQMQELPATSSKDEARTFMRASIFLVKKAIDDKVYAVFKASLNLLKMLLTEYIPRFKLSRSDTIYCCDKTLPNLLHKSGDTAVRNRDDAKKFVMEMANFTDVKPTNCVPHECVKPFKTSIAPRLAQSRCEIVELQYKELGLSGGLTVENLMIFCVRALSHNAGEVREVAERIIRSLYKEVGQPVKDFLPADTDKTRKNTLWRQLFEYFDKVDGKPSKSDVKRQKADAEAQKQAEIVGLQKQLQQLKDMASGKQPINEGSLKEDSRKPAKKVETRTKAPKTKAKIEEDSASVYNMDNICIFCAERNETFTEDGLDLHYWKSCPMLKRCANCKQVVEIASYTDHLLTECESRKDYSKCPRCTEAIPKPDYDQHVSEKSCNAAKQNTNHCPLCHQNIDSGEDGWKDHLMGRDGCKQNPRRLLALNRPQGKVGGKGVPPARSKVKGGKK